MENIKDKTTLNSKFQSTFIKKITLQVKKKSIAIKIVHTSYRLLGNFNVDISTTNNDSIIDMKCLNWCLLYYNQSIKWHLFKL